jgi:hypothetical protein
MKYRYIYSAFLALISSGEEVGEDTLAVAAAVAIVEGNDDVLLLIDGEADGIDCSGTGLAAGMGCCDCSACCCCDTIGVEIPLTWLIFSTIS